MSVDLTLVVPCYHEEGHLAASVQTVTEVLDQTRWSWEIVFVEDGSRDRTADVVRDLCAADPRRRAIFHERNRGRGAAFKTGFAASHGRVTGFVDIDLEVHARYIPSLVTEIEQHDADVATGNRHYLLRQTGGFHRAVSSRVYRSLCNLLLGLDVEDSETGCKFFRRATATDVVLGSGNDGWFWDTEVMARARLANLAISELPVLFLRRADKTSTVRFWRDSFEYLRALYRFRGTIGLSRRSKSPIYWTGIGYDAVMRALYGRQYRQTYEVVAQRIPAGASVVDVCCGTARLYRDFLRQRGCRYLGLDASADFVMHARRRGVDARWFNMLTDPIPEADYVVMCSSLYQAGTRARDIVDRMRHSAREAVIISEPVRNLTQVPVVGGLAAALTNSGASEYRTRFDLARFTALVESFGGDVVHAPGDRNALGVLRARLGADGAPAPRASAGAATR